MNLSNITLLTATFNRHDFTLNMLNSFVETVSNEIMPIVIIDNSTIFPFPNVKNERISIIDNTNFKYTKNYNQPSKNHCSSINFALSQINTDYVMLCDNDILFKPSVKQLLKIYNDFDIIGEIGWDKVPPLRIYPYFCILNLNFIRKNKISYFDEKRCMINNGRMDTGSSFYEDCMKTKFRLKKIKVSDYVIHLKNGTLKNRTVNDLYIKKSLVVG